MYRQSPSRTQRSKGIKTKHVLQICLLLAVCFWLIYQVKHSHDKKKEFDESDSKSSLSRASSNEILTLGRKDIHPRVEETVNKNGKHDEAAIEQETIEEEEVEDKKHEEDEQNINKAERNEDEGTGGEEDEINEHEHEKSDVEIDREEEFIDEEKAGHEGDENSTKEKDSEENNGEMEKVSLEDSDHDGDEHSAHEAREENYKADDASSAVAHDNQVVDPENENGSFENAERPKTNILERENKENDGEGINLGDKRSDLEVNDGDVAISDNQLNETTNEAEENLKENSENSSLSNTTLTEGTIDHREKSNNLSEVRMEARDPSLLNGTENKFELNHGQNRSIGGTTSGKANNSSSDEVNNLVDSNSRILVKNKDSESSSGEFSDSSNSSESSVSKNIRLKSSVEAGNNTESLTEKNDATGVEKSDTYGGKDEFSDQTSEEVQHDPIISSDSSNSLDEKDVRTDLETLPDIQTAGTSIEDAAAE
ncbi:Hypothetical predicted protein [Olea europaea subsp. europaea]|nr:Hypothetical predicted protein [Olea europaea subsp. europaea]